MKIVIELSDETYKDIKEENSIYGINNGLSARMTGKVVGAIQNGKPLPKGHGDLIDINRKITVPVYDEQYGEWGEKTLTVREALNKWSDEGIIVKDVVVLADNEQKNKDK